MTTTPTSTPTLPGDINARLRELIIEVCDLDGVTPADFDDDRRLINGPGPISLGSLDALEIAAAIEREWGVRIEDLSAAKTAFRTLGSLAAHVAQARGGA
jgi:acyl carrier protein